MAEKVHWADQAAGALLKNASNVVASGTSISGEPHIGNIGDVVRANIVARSVAEAGGEASESWVSDNMDPLRRVPSDVPANFKEYLGFPLSDIPDPKGCHKSFTAHYEEIVLGQSALLGARPRAFLGRDMYRDGTYNEAIRTAFEKRRAIAAILNKFREKPLEEDWFPYNPICEKCGRIATTRVTAYDDNTGEIDYVCESTVVGKDQPVEGCGHAGRMKYDEGKGKLVWRVEWPARWKILGVTCEPFGKEHAASGGSWDTGKLISEQVYGCPAPYPIIYEHFMVGGKKMSKSFGNVVTVRDWLDAAPAEALRYYMLAGDIGTARDMGLKDVVPHVVEEYQHAERLHYGKERESERVPEEVRAKWSRIYLLSQVDAAKVPSEMPMQLGYGFASLLAQVARSDEAKIAVLKRTGHWRDSEKESLLGFIAMAGSWVQRYRHENFYLEFVSPEESRKLLDQQALGALAAFLENYRSKDLRSAVAATCEASGTTIEKLFALIYLALLGKRKGPRLASLEEALGKDFLLDKLARVVG
jgi:lysyl-tRNA synthetase class 1